MAADLVVAGGMVVDGTGAPPKRADVAVTGGRISEIGPGLHGHEMLDATGQVVSPGFIDIHTHYDAQVFFDPALTPSCYHGVTTVVAGNCGFSIAPTRPEMRELIARTLESVEDMDYNVLLEGVPWDFTTFPEYLDSVRRRGAVLNFAAYVGHTALRLFAMGESAYDRTATEDECRVMAGIVREAMEAGAAGLATSFAPPHNGADHRPVPSRLADRAELDALLRAIAGTRRGVVAVAPGELVGISDLYELQRATGLPFTYGALLTSPAGRHDDLLELNRRGRSEGADVWPQVTSRPLTFVFGMDAPYLLNVNPEFRALGACSIEKRRKSYLDSDWRRRAWDGFVGVAMPPRWDTYEIAGRRVVDLARGRGCTPLDVILDAATETPDLKLEVRCVIANDDQAGVARLLRDDTCTLGLSDAGAHVGQLCDAPQATDFLGLWVRDRELMPIETAVRKLTGVQADLFGFPDRGYLRPGGWADIVVFDPDTVAPGPIRRVRDFPGGSARLTADQPLGITHVLVNGTPIRRSGEPVDEGVGRRPGQVISPMVRQ
ncbi:MAG: amidohydrolase family protein [Actinomycetota bacterium]|nr:amidohydrolase family protein [Actinomycetota bacterium]